MRKWESHAAMRNVSQMNNMFDGADSGKSQNRSQKFVWGMTSFSLFPQVEFLLSGLFQLKERIDDTEDLINIELDHRRNELVSLDLLVTIGELHLNLSQPRARGF